MLDNSKARFGNGGDLAIHHGGGPSGGGGICV